MFRSLVVAALTSSLTGTGTALDTGSRVSRNVSLRAAAPAETVPRAAAQLRASSTSRSNATSHGAMPCQCQGFSQAWSFCARTVPKCIFIDLGAADGNSFRAFLNGEYGALANCPSGGAWEAVLVEANPRFKVPLEQAAAIHPGAVETHAATAAYMCEGQTSFYLDTVTVAKNYWGSSMADNHPDVVNSGKQKVTVNTLNLNRVLLEKTIPGDYVLVKMDIEGAEFDIIPCLAHSPAADLMDALWLEQHDPSWGLAGNTLQTMNEAKAALQSKGVYMPNYFSPTLLTKRMAVHHGSHA